MIIVFLVVLVALVPPSISVGGEFVFVHSAMKLNVSMHDLWCYEETHCKQGSINSSWERGLCKSGWSQSPINLNPRLKTSSLKDSKGFHFSSATRSLYDLYEYKLEHKGHTVSVIPPPNHLIQFEWPEKPWGTYRLEEVHFHWGTTNYVGSEHLLDLKSYAIEVHLVHYRVKGPTLHPGYSSIHEAVLSGDKNALAVIAVLVHADYTRKTRSFLEPVAKALPKIASEGNRTVIKDPAKVFKLGEVLKQESQMFVYEGSLTTPPCSEIVLWLVLRHPVQAREKEVATFRNIRTFTIGDTKNNKTMEIPESTTFRKVQPNYPKQKGKGGKGHIHVRLIDIY